MEGRLQAWALPHLSSLGSNTNFTSLTIVGKYFSAAPCKTRSKQIAEAEAVWQKFMSFIITMKNPAFQEEKGHILDESLMTKHDEKQEN